MIAAATRIFTTRGPTASMREIAVEAGVGLGTLYRHFPDKESLLAGVVQDRMLGLIEETRHVMETLSAWDAFATTMRRMAAMMDQDRAFAGAIGAVRARPVDAEGVVAELDRVLGELAERARVAGELRDDVGPPELGLLLAGAAMAPSDAGSASDRGSARDTYLSVVLDGLRRTSQGASARPSGQPISTRSR